MAIVALAVGAVAGLGTGGIGVEMALSLKGRTHIIYTRLYRANELRMERLSKFIPAIRAPSLLIYATCALLGSVIERTEK